MKVAISLPDDLFEQAEAEATKLGISRSRLIQVALEKHLSAQRDAALTENINRALDRNRDLCAEDIAWSKYATRNLSEALASDDWSE